MINEQDFVGLAKDCSNLCGLLVEGTRGRNLNGLSPPVRKAIDDLNK